MGVIVNELEVVVEAPSPERETVPADLAAPKDLGKPVPRVLTVHDLERIRQDLRARELRLAAD